MDQSTTGRGRIGYRWPAQPTPVVGDAAAAFAALLAESEGKRDDRKAR